MPSRRLHTIASGSAFNLLPTKVWKQEKEKLLVMLSSKTTPFLSSNQGKTSHTKFDMCKKCAKNLENLNWSSAMIEIIWAAIVETQSLLSESCHDGTVTCLCVVTHLQTVFWSERFRCSDVLRSWRKQKLHFILSMNSSARPFVQCFRTSEHLRNQCDYDHNFCLQWKQSHMPLKTSSKHL